MRPHVDMGGEDPSVSNCRYEPLIEENTLFVRQTDTKIMETPTGSPNQTFITEPTTSSQSSAYIVNKSLSTTSHVPEGEFEEYEIPLRLRNSQFMLVQDVGVHCFIELGQGGPDTQWLVLLHGFGGGIFSWKRTVDKLLPFCKGILAFDRPGFGLTQRPAEDARAQDDLSPYSTAFNLIILKTLMEKNDIPEAVLVGHSTGGSLACFFANEYPDKVKGLVLIAPCTGLPSFILSILRTKLGKTVVLNLVKSEIGQVTIQRSWHNPDTIPESVTTPYKGALKLPRWGDALVAMSHIENKTNLSGACSQIKAPVLMLHGDDDKLVGFQESKRISEKFPVPAQLIKIRHCGHMPHEELPDVFAQHVSEFLEFTNETLDLSTMSRKVSGTLDTGPLLKNETEDIKENHI